jgi:hypothetical protein
MTMNWRSVVSKTVHAPAVPPNPLTNMQVNPKFTANIPRPLPNLWVENGVIWQLPSLLIGFTSYTAAKDFFASLHGTGMGAVPSNWYQGKPFSSVDFPILYDQFEYSKSKKIKPDAANQGATTSTTDWSGYNCLIWPSLEALPSIKIFFSMLGSPTVKAAHGHASSAGPVVPISAIGSFSADSPGGQGTFSAKYVMYVPGGISTKTSDAGIQYDMSTYCWTRKWITNQYDSGGDDCSC